MFQKGLWCLEKPSAVEDIRIEKVSLNIRAIYTGENKTHLVRRDLYRLYDRVLHKTRRFRINDPRLIFETAHL